MSDDKGEGVPLPGEEEDVDYVFKAQMGLYKSFAAYWKHGLALVALILSVSLVYGLGTSYVDGRLKDGAQEIASIDRRMPQPSQMAQFGMAPLDDPDDAQHMANLTEGAKRYEAAAAKAIGASAAEGWLKAGDTWLRVGKPDEARAAYAQALSAKDAGIFGYAAHNALAKMDMAAGDIASAQGHMRSAADLDKGFLGETALLQLAELHHAAGDTAAVTELSQEFQLRYPSSPRLADWSDYGVTLTAAPVEAETEG